MWIWDVIVECFSVRVDVDDSLEVVVKSYSQLMVACSLPVLGSRGRSASLRMSVYFFAGVRCQLYDHPTLFLLRHCDRAI